LEPDLRHVRKVLIRGVNWVGDTILTYPAVNKLRRLLPQCHLAVLVPDHLVDLWKTCGAVDEIVGFRKAGPWDSLKADVRLSRSLKRRGFDAALILPRSFHSAFLVRLAQVPIRIGYRSEGRSALLTHAIRRTDDLLRIHRVRYYERLTEPFGKTEEQVSPRLSLREEDRTWAEEVLKGSGFLNGRTLIGINPGATYGLAKCWPPDRFGELGRRLAEKWKAGIVVFGKEEERPASDEILRQVGRSGLDLTGKTSLLQLGALLERCRLLVTNDTGTMHVAAAVGISVAAIFGSTDPVTTGPFGEGHVLVKKDVPCSPCLKRICPTDHRCMKLITVEDVEGAVNSRLEVLMN
jgi:heptosyltransferase II